MKRKTKMKGDKAAARELILFADNESSIYPQRVAIHKNLLRKIKAGKYSDTKAAKLWGYWFETAAKSYARQMANPSDWNRIFSAATRRLAARTYASREGRILRAAARGETDDYVYKNPKKRRKMTSGESRQFFDRMYERHPSKARAWHKPPSKRYYAWDASGNAVAHIDVTTGTQLREFRRKHRGHRVSTADKVKRNPTGAYLLVASKGGGRQWYNGKNKFTSNRAKAKVFGSSTRAMEKARELARKFPILRSFALYPETYRHPK